MVWFYVWCLHVCVCKIRLSGIVYIREQEPSEGVQEDDIDYKDEEEFEPKGYLAV